MSFIDNLTQITANLGLGKLTPTNSDAIRDSMKAYRENSRSARVTRQAGRDARTSTDSEMLEKANRSHELAQEAQNMERMKTARAHGNDTIAKMQTYRRYQAAMGVEAGSEATGKKLTSSQLADFRKENNKAITDYTKEARKAGRQLRDHTKDYFMSGDLGTNALRWGAAGAAYGGVAVGTRVMSGGSATTNNQGQRDIAGIPFL